MASGRRDYWNVLDFGKLTYSVYQTPIYQYGYKDIATTAQDTLVDYTVPAGYRVHILNVMVSCQRAGINIVFCTLTGVGVRYSYFDTVLIFPPTDSGDIVVDEGGVVQLIAENLDGVTNRFWGSVHGYLEAKS